MTLGTEPKSTDLPKSSPSPMCSDGSAVNKASKWQQMWRVVTYTPKRSRYDAETPPPFSMGLNLLFGFAGTFTVANLYYNHPVLNKIADDFNITNERSSLVPTMAQTGYAAGLIFLCPLGDLFPRRPFVLLLVLFTATVW